MLASLGPTSLVVALLWCEHGLHGVINKQVLAFCMFPLAGMFIIPHQGNQGPCLFKSVESYVLLGAKQAQGPHAARVLSQVTLGLDSVMVCAFQWNSSCRTLIFVMGACPGAWQGELK